MNADLPIVIAAFFHAHNTGHTDDFSQLFTDDALVSDEAHEYRGADIKVWIDGAIAKYRPVADVTDLADVGEQTIATAQVSGSFPGSRYASRKRIATRRSRGWQRRTFLSMAPAMSDGTGTL
ncbi:MAG: nuclear transport factor 2 family protein [Steroidobacteraceae bacterium]|jgi:hypothetical protein